MPRGVTLVEVLAVVSVIAILLGMGFLLHGHMREAARVATAESRLRQVSTGLELYFRKYHCYPPQTASLPAELAPFVDDPAVFENPLRDEAAPGETLDHFYRQPSLAELDTAGTYVTAFLPQSDGDPVVILETGDRVVRKSTAGHDPATFQLDTLLAVLYPPVPDPSDEAEGGSGGEEGGSDEPATVPEEPPSDAAPDYFTDEPTEGVTQPKGCCDASFQVRAADLTWGPDGPQVPIAVSVVLGGSADGQSGTHSLFGGADVDGGEQETLVLKEGQTFALEAAASYGSWSAVYSSGGAPHQVLTLRNGDQPVEFDPYQNPISVGPGLQGLIDPATGTVTIDDREVLYCVELGSTSRASTGFDFQDLIVLARVGEPSNPAECETTPLKDEGFEIGGDGEVVTKLCSDVTIKAIGSQFGYEDGTMVDVAAAAKIGNCPWFDLYGGQPVDGGESYTCPTVPAGTPITLRGEILGDYERWLWTEYGYPLSYTNTDGSDQVLAYKNGDAPPDFAPGFPCQASAGDLVASYIDPQTGVVTIADNEALYLWDFNPVWTDYGIDYQDLIILANAATADYECEDEGIASNSSEDPDGESTPPTTPINYTAVRDAADTIKFEGAAEGLGENFVKETDTFTIAVSGSPSSVTVTTKAATSSAISTLDLSQPGDDFHDANGFIITYVGTDGGGSYTFTVSSVDNRHALSHVEFDFDTGDVQTPAGTVEAGRVRDA
jgi:prepilin-type N-terminal cleavage/methylation domain-containing protein